MGFSVTAAHAIFFVAMLSSASAVAGVYWKNQDLLHEARRDEAARQSNIMRTSINVTSIECVPLGCGILPVGSTLRYDVHNRGDTVLNATLLVHLMHGDVLAAEPLVAISDAQGNTVAGTSMLMPGEKATITHTLSASYVGVILRVVTEYGVGASGRAG